MGLRPKPPGSFAARSLLGAPPPDPRWDSAPGPLLNGVWGRAPTGSGAEPRNLLAAKPPRGLVRSPAPSWLRPCFSIIDAVQEGEGQGLSVLRTFRLLRIIKLVRFLPALRHQLGIMIETLDEVAVFFVLMALFVFIFR